MVLAVLGQHTPIRGVGLCDVYASTVGGVSVSEPAADLAVALAVASASTSVALPAGTLAIGEVGLAGEVRPVPGVPRRLAEAARLGFTVAVVPRHSGPGPEGMRVVEVDHVGQAVDGALRR